MEQQEEKLLKARMLELITTLQQWDYEYYILDNPSVEDSIYDQKLLELKNLEKNCNLSLDDSPTNKLNSKIYKQSKFKLVRRQVPMLSIDNTSSREGLLSFDKRVKKLLNREKVDYLCELKIDGLSASIIYKQKKLFQISTRGNGFLGEDVTFNKEVVTGLPSSSGYEFPSEVRGEIYMREEEFADLNKDISERGLKKLANARNAAAGTLRTIILNKERKLRFFAYQYFVEGIGSQLQCLETLSRDGFEVSEYKLCENIEEVFAYTKEISQRRDKIGFSIDGIVVKVNDYEYHKILGETNKFPRWAIAYKFTPLSALSRIKAINTAVSKNGRITYVASIEKVTIAGSSIGNVTLHNFAFIEKKKLNIGNQVLISKAGDVIPQIIEVLENNGEAWEAPLHCLSCESELLWAKSKLYQICPDINCPEKNVNYLAFFVSKSAIDIKGVSKSIVEKLFNAKLVERPYDFYKLANQRSELYKIETFKEKSIVNLLDAIDRSRYKSLASFITAFSIPLLSSVKARSFANMFNGQIELLLIFLRNGKFESLGDKLGVKTGDSIKNFFQDKLNFENFEQTAAEMIFLPTN